MIGGVVVLYFPDEILLARLLCAICNQVSKIYIINNTPLGSSMFLNDKWFYKKKFDVVYVTLGDNYGIAKAQNVGIDLAIRDGYEHVIFFDQDSAPSERMVSKLVDAEIKLMKLGIKVGTVGPLFIDEKTGKYSEAILHGVLRKKRISILPSENIPVKTDYIISSGSLTRVKILQKIGNMREELFIDWVDIEWGLRAKGHGYQSFIVPTAIMKHSVGDGVTSVGGRIFNLHGDIRNYYIVRNACYLFSQKTMGWKWRLNVILKIPQYVIFYSIFSTSKNKFKTFFLLMRACFDGFCRRLGRAF